MTDRFDEIFFDVVEEEKAVWWEIFDGPAFEEVEKRIAQEFGDDVFDTEEYIQWYQEMAEEL